MPTEDLSGSNALWFPTGPNISSIGAVSLPKTAVYATDENGNQVLVRYDVTVSKLVSVWNQSISLTAALKVGVSVKSLPYALNNQTTITAVLKVGAVIKRLLQVSPPGAIITVAALAPTVSTGVVARVSAAAVTAEPLAPVVSGGASVLVPAVGVAVAGLMPEYIVRPKTVVEVPVADIAVAGVIPLVASGASVAVPFADVTVKAEAPTQTGPDKDPYFSSVSLLLHMDGTNNSTSFADASSNAFTVTAAGNAKVITGNKKFGSAALSLDGSASYLSVASNSAFDMGTGDWTIELWTYTTDQTKIYPALIANNGSWGTNATSLRWETSGSTQKFTLNYNTTTSGGIVLLETGTYSFNQWRHIAAVRNGTTLRIYVDGAQAASMTIASTVAFNWSAGGYIYVGHSWDGSNSDMTETIDEVRITKGVARYTAAFTAPTKPFPNA